MGYVGDLTNSVNGIRQISLLFSTSHTLLAKAKNFPIYFPLFPIRSDLRDTMRLNVQSEVDELSSYDTSNRIPNAKTLRKT